MPGGNQINPSVNISDPDATISRKAIMLDITKWKPMIDFFNPQPEAKGGRCIQLFWFAFFAVLFVAGTMVQVYTDSELSDQRQEKVDTVAQDRDLVNAMFDLAELLGREAEIMYQYNNGSYDTFVQKAQDILRAVDTKLLWNADWPGSEDLAMVSHEQRINITSPDVLRKAVRSERDLRKSPNGLDEVEILNFYITIVDALSTVGGAIVLKASRFGGWQDFLAVTPVFQTWMNFKKYYAIANKLCIYNYTLSTSDPQLQMMMEFYAKYQKFMSIATKMSDYAEGKIANLTAQDSTKNVEYQHHFIAGLNLAPIVPSDFIDAMLKHDKNIEFVLTSLRIKADEEFTDHIHLWPANDVFSVPLFAVAAAFAVATFFFHIFGTLKEQSQMIKYHKNLHELKEALTLVYDCIPKDLIEKAMTGSIFPVQHFEDTCVMIMDIFNIEDMSEGLEIDKFADFIEETYYLAEHILRKYNCFKIDISGRYFVLGAGCGEHHVLDHVLELVCVALDMQDSVDALKKDDDHEGCTQIRLRTGIHFGPCYSRILYLQVPHMAFVGDLLHQAALLHASGMPMKVQVSAAVYNRLNGKTDLVDFTHRGRLGAHGEGDNDFDVYWVTWVDNTKKQDDAENTI